MEDNINILIVDDTPEHIHIATNLLKTLNYPIRVATSASKALMLIEKKKPTLILLDITMPDMNGFQLCSLLKKNPLYSDIAIIFMTSAEDEESIKKGFSLGAQDYVVKPYNPSELLARVNTHIKLASQSIKLKASYKELDQFCHTVSHDLKSPLLVLKQLANLLSLEANDSLSPTSKEIIKRIENKSDDIILMIERLLDFSRINQIQCFFEEINISEVFYSVMEELSSLEPNRKIDFIVSPFLPIIKGDKTLIKFLIQNILSNALKFSKNNDLTIIKVNCTTLENYYEISIKDNGAGFDMSYKNKLFHIFERLHSKEEFDGSGVGLVIVKRIMERHKGKVFIEGEPNKGACVKLYFPI